MILRAAGFLACCLMLAGCAGPMSQREAQNRADHRLAEFCRETPCGPGKLVRAQKIKDRWLVDFETQSGLYTVTVDSGGNTQVSIWDKNVPR